MKLQLHHPIRIKLHHFLIIFIAAIFLASSVQAISFIDVGGFATGKSKSASFILESGTNLTDFSPRSGIWQWYDDEESETPAIPLAPPASSPSNLS